MKKNYNIRWAYLALGTVAMLFAGIIYAWSILNIPFGEKGFGWSATQLSLNFTLTMSFFCLGGLAGAQLGKRIGHRLSLVLAGILSFVGFMSTSFLSDRSVLVLYVTYGLIGGFGIGIAYNVLLSVVGAWFPDKKGLSSGFLTMGFGASSLVLGKVAGVLFESSLGWRTTYILLGAGLGIVLAVAGIVLKKPDKNVMLPAPKATAAASAQDFTPRQMLRHPSFYLAFVYLVFLTAVGSFVISFARNLSLEVGASASLAATLVGVVGICNGLGRILTGACFDSLGWRKTMYGAASLTALAAGTMLLSVWVGSLSLGILGLCLTGLSYGTSPAIATAYTAAFYGSRYYPTNMAIMIFNSMASYFVATFCTSLLTAAGSFVVPFTVLLGLAVLSFVLNIFIKKP